MKRRSFVKGLFGASVTAPLIAKELTKEDDFELGDGYYDIEVMPPTREKIAMERKRAKKIFEEHDIWLNSHKDAHKRFNLWCSLECERTALIAEKVMKGYQPTEKNVKILNRMIKKWGNHKKTQ